MHSHEHALGADVEVEVEHMQIDDDVTENSSNNDPLASGERSLSAASQRGAIFKKDLAKWAVSTKQTRKSMNSLLSLLRKEDMDLPKDCRTLCGTPKNTSAQIA